MNDPQAGESKENPVSPQEEGDLSPETVGDLEPNDEAAEVRGGGTCGVTSPRAAPAG